MVLALSRQQLSAMCAHAERVYPEECCGLMVGTLTSSVTCQDSAQRETPDKSLVELVSLNNEWTPDVLSGHQTTPSPEQSYSKQRRYWIDPKDMLRVQKQARDQGLNIIGIYHSHPDHVAEPSECDRVLAWPDYAYVIVSVHGGKAVDVKNWALDSDHQFQPEVMKVSPSSPRDRMPVSA